MEKALLKCRLYAILTEMRALQMVTQIRLITDEGPAVYGADPLRRRGLDGVRQEVPAAQDQPRDASAQDGRQEHPIKVQSIRRGQGSECQFMVNNMRRSGGSKNFVRSVSVQADENKCNV